MNIDVKATGIELTPAISDYISRKLEGISKFVSKDAPDTVCHVEVGKTTDHHKHGDIFRAEVRIFTHGQDTYVEAEASDLYAAIDEVRDEIVHKLSSAKDKNASLTKKGGARVKAMIKGFFGSHE
jgi:ribosomal subunit interface protein